MYIREFLHEGNKVIVSRNICFLGNKRRKRWAPDFNIQLYKPANGGFYKAYLDLVQKNNRGNFCQDYTSTDFPGGLHLIHDFILDNRLEFPFKINSICSTKIKPKSINYTYKAKPNSITPSAIKFWKKRKKISKAYFNKKSNRYFIKFSK